MTIFFFWKVNLITEITKELCLTNYKSNYVRRKYLVPLNKIFFSARRVSRYVGRDVIGKENVVNERLYSYVIQST